MVLWEPDDAILPITSTTLLIGTACYALSFPHRINRHVVLLCVTLSACASFLSSHDLIPDASAEDTYLRSIIMFTAHIWYLLSSQYKVRSDVQMKTIDSQAAPELASSSTWKRGYKLLFNYRGIGTSWEIPHLRDRGHGVQAETAIYKKTDEPGLLRTRTAPGGTKFTSRFCEILRRFSILVVRFLLLCLWYELHDPASHFLVPSDSTPDKEVLLRRFLGIYPNSSLITRRELAIRAWVIIANHVQDCLKISALHDVFAIVFIGVGLDEGWEWPPIFGSISEAYSVRRYWSRFWHAVIYRSFSAHATVVLHGIGIRSHNLPTRFLKNWMVFAMSAIMHGLVDWKLYPRCAYSRSLLWWLMQPMAFILEGLVCYGWRKLLARRRVPSTLILVFERLAGYCWVFAWMFWSVPKRAYPLMQCGG